MGILNNREISIIIWFSILFVVVLFNKGVRDALKNIINIALCKQILIPVAIMAFYVLIIIYLLYQFGLWRTDQVKNTIVWFFSVAIVSMLGINNIKDNPHYFKDTLKNNLKIIVIIQFIISVYTFNLITEIIFVPFMFFLGLLIAVSSLNEEHKIVETFLNKLLVYIGVGIIIYTIFKLLTEFSAIYQEKTFYDFIVPTLLSILFLPFLFLFSVFMNYESVFVRLSVFTEDEKVLKYAKQKSFKSFLFNTSALQRWFKIVACNKLHSKKDVDKSISNIIATIKREKNPIDVNLKEGWSPYEAMEYLKEEGLKTGYYQELYDEEWFASSPMKELGGDIFPNNVAYYIAGAFDVVSVLKIKLNINNFDCETQDLNYFITLAELLCSKALNAELSNTLTNALVNKEVSFVEKLSSKQCKVERSENLNNDGYSLKFSINNNTSSSKESLPTPRPLRTVRESFPSYGSSLSKEKSDYDFPQ